MPRAWGREYSAEPAQQASGHWVCERHNYLEITGEPTFSEAFRQLASHGHRLYVIGYVDYMDPGVDRQGSAHTAYCSRPEFQRTIEITEQGVRGMLQSRQTRFDRTLYDARSNLVLLTKPGYNYDRPRNKGEGNDWG